MKYEIAFALKMIGWPFRGYEPDIYPTTTEDAFFSGGEEPDLQDMFNVCDNGSGTLRVYRLEDGWVARDARVEGQSMKTYERLKDALGNLLVTIHEMNNDGRIINMRLQQEEYGIRRR